MKLESIAWFLPAHNEAANLPHVVPNIHEYLTALGCPFTIIVVDDGSEDLTFEVASKLTIDYPEVQVVQHLVNQGYGAALRTGLQASLETGHELIGFCDADDQFRIDSLGPMLTSIQGADAVYGFREQRADTLKRRLMGRGWHHVSRFALSYTARDVDCGFKLFRRVVIAEIMPRLSGNYATISPEIIARVQRANFRVAETVVEHHPRQHGMQSGASLKVIFGSFIGLWRMRHLIESEA